MHLSYVILSLIFLLKPLRFHVFSSFEKSEIVQNNCPDLQKTKIILNVENGLMECARICNRQSTCRRFLYCSSDNECQLFYDGTDCLVLGDSTSCKCYRKKIGCHDNKCTCPLGFYGNRCENIVQDCQETVVHNMTQDIPQNRLRVHIKPRLSQKSFTVVCFLHKDVTGMIILHRLQKCDPENFNRSMSEYQEGFGIFRNHWIGFDKLLAVMNSSGLRYSLSIVMDADDDEYCVLTYYDIHIGNESTGYMFSSSAVFKDDGHDECTDSILLNNTLPFSTYDSDHTGTNNCSARFGGGWWFHDTPNCTRGFLTGTMDGAGTDNFWLDGFAGKKLNLMRMYITQLVIGM